jgi:hypothetical protein
VVYEWNGGKAKANIQNHGVSFDEAATVFLDPLALTFPIHFIQAKRSGRSRSATPRNIASSSFRIASAETAFESSAHERRPEESTNNMKKASVKSLDDDLRPEYDLSKLKGGVRGKYYRQAAAGTNLMLIEPELAKVFGDAESVNRALRLLVDTAQAAARPARRRPDAPK